MADKSDPRLPSAVRHYVPPIVNPNDLPPDYSSLAAIIFGILGVMLKVRLIEHLQVETNFLRSDVSLSCCLQPRESFCNNLYKEGSVLEMQCCRLALNLRDRLMKLIALRVYVVKGLSKTFMYRNLQQF